MGWGSFAAVIAAFFATHSLPLRPAIRARLVARMGARGFSLAYSALSLVMLWLLIRSAGQAPFVMLWPQAPWQVALVRAGMFVVCLLVAFGVGRPNPFSFGGRDNGRFDPARAGIVRHLRHPVLAALALWAGLHLLANGDLAHAILFGLLGGFALAGMGLVDRRRRRALGEAEWQRLQRALAQAPRLQPPLSWAGVGLRLAAAVALYLALLALHGPVIGVALI
ncbi:MAG: NnrU family protein [Roseovarius sp.]